MNQRKNPVKNRMRWIELGTLALLVSAVCSCSSMPGNTSKMQENRMPEMQVLTVPVTRGSITTSQEFVGNVQYNQSATLTWKTNGVVGKIYVKVGDQVKKGDILAELETDSLESTVLLAEKTMIEKDEALEDVMNSTMAAYKAYQTLSEKEAVLKEKKMEQEVLYYPRATQDEMERAWDDLQLANLNFNYAKQDYDALDANNEPWYGEEEGTLRKGRDGSTFLTGVNGQSGRERKFEDYVSTYNTLVDAYETYEWTAGQPDEVDYAVAEGNVEVAQKEYDAALEEYLSYERMPRLKDVNAARVSLSSAENTYKKRFIIAQFDGTVTSISAVEGYYVAKGDTALRIDDISRIFVPVDVPELDVKGIQNGTAVTVSLDAVSAKDYNGSFYSVSESSSNDGFTTAFSAMVLIDNPDEELRSGMTASVRIEKGTKTDVLLIPNSALTYKDGTPYVTVADAEGNRDVAVKLGTVGDNVSEITEGEISEGTPLVVSSITEKALTAMGLNPEEYMPKMPQGMPGNNTLEDGQMPSMNGEMPEGGQMPPMDGEMPEGGQMLPMNGEMPEGGQMPPKSSGNAQNSEQQPEARTEE